MPSIDQLERLLAADPRDAFVLYGLAQEHAKAGGAEGHRRAVEYYDRCLEVDPEYAYAYFHKARSLAAMGRAREAASTVRAGLAAAGRAGDAHAGSELAALLEELE